MGLWAAPIAAMGRSCARRLGGLGDRIRDAVAAAPVKHRDETGFRIGGKPQWLPVCYTPVLTFYQVCARRGTLLNEIATVTGTVVYDPRAPYDTLTGVCHALCNEHPLRELKALMRFKMEDWARQMYGLLRHARYAATLATKRGCPWTSP
jgi:transposase